MTPQKGKSVRVAVKVTPNAGRNEITGCKEGVWQIKIQAPPDKGKANKELVDFLAETMDIKKSAVMIVQGSTSRHKVLAVEGLSGEEIQKRLDK